MDDVVICVRTADERTVNCLLEDIKIEFPSVPVKVFKTSPFSQTLKEAYLYSLESKKKWSIHFDGDVLLIPGASRTMLKAISQLDSGIFSAQFYVADPLMGTLRAAGNQIYQRDYLPLAIPFAASSYNQLRPEKYVINMMMNTGLGFVDFKSESIIGLHDAQQFYRDIYRKSLVFSFKHLNKANDYIPYWRKNESNIDFKIARKGFADGVLYWQKIHIDTRLTEGVLVELSGWLKEQGIEEKEPLSSFSLAERANIVSEVLNRHLSQTIGKGI